MDFVALFFEGLGEFGVGCWGMPCSGDEKKCWFRGVHCFAVGILSELGECGIVNDGSLPCKPEKVRFI